MSEKFKVVGGQGPPITCAHRRGGEVKPVQVGNYTIWAGGGMYLTEEDKAGFDLLIDLREEGLPKGISFGDMRDKTLYLPVRDFEAVATKHLLLFGKRMLRLRNRFRDSERVLIFCAGGHGRTGLVLCYILLQHEPMIVDPVAEVRRRYCERAVESHSQHEQVRLWQQGAMATKP